MYQHDFSDTSKIQHTITLQCPWKCNCDDVLPGKTNGKKGILLVALQWLHNFVVTLFWGLNWKQAWLTYNHENENKTLIVLIADRTAIQFTSKILFFSFKLSCVTMTSNILLIVQSMNDLHRFYVTLCAPNPKLPNESPSSSKRSLTYGKLLYVKQMHQVHGRSIPRYGYPLDVSKIRILKSRCSSSYAEFCCTN